jgi:hypothetical protein
MPFKSSQDAETRLRDSAKLTTQEVQDLFPYMNQLSIAGERRLTAELALQNLEAVQKFETSSSKLTQWLIGLTVVLLLLTGVIAWYSYVLARAEKKVAVASPSDAAQQSSAKPDADFIGARKNYRGYEYVFDGKKWKKGQQVMTIDLTQNAPSNLPLGEDQYNPLVSLTEKKNRKYF